MGTSGGVASTVFVDGWLAGPWRVEEDEPVVVELFRELTGAQRSELDDERGAGASPAGGAGG